MKKKIFCSSYSPRTLLYAITGFLLVASIPKNSQAQNMRPLKSEIATCEVKMSKNTEADIKKTTKNNTKLKDKLLYNRNTRLEPNQIGYFNPVFNIKPMEKVPIELAYPNGHAGEKVVVMVLDGGKLDNGKAVKVVPLDNQKKCSFIFQVSDDPGMYQLVLRKGQDNKMIQLWVGKEILPVKK